MKKLYAVPTFTVDEFAIDISASPIDSTATNPLDNAKNYNYEDNKECWNSSVFDRGFAVDNGQVIRCR